VKGPVINCMKKKRQFQTYKKVLFKGWLLKGKTHFLQSKNICTKNFKAKKVVSDNLPEFSFKSGSKRASFHKNRWLEEKRC
jgi:hypothetical protein